jgi:O-antigen ligase
MELGYFAVIVATIGIGMCRNPNNRTKGVLLYLFGAATVYSTLIRTVYLQLIISTIAALILTFGRKPNRVKWLPLAAVAAAIAFAVGGASRMFVGYNNGLASNASLEVRLDQWTFYASMFRHSPIWNQLFGFGICQADNKVVRSLAVVDNLFWGLTLHIGLVGLVIMLVLLWAMWLRVRAEAIENPTPLTIGLASFWATFAMSGVFENSPAIFGFWYIVGVLSSGCAGAIAIKQLHMGWPRSRTEEFAPLRNLPPRFRVSR